MDKTDQNPEVSIIITTYNAANYLASSIKNIETVMDSTLFTYELVFVDDHSSDDSVLIINRLIENKKYRSIHIHDRNCGRGKAVSEGLRRARGNIIGFIDIDLEIQAESLIPMILGIKENALDVCTARRIYVFRWGFYFIMRLIFSQTYARFSSWILQTRLQDTETGCKFFRKSAILPLLDSAKEDGWFWDTEIMTRAYYAGLHIQEIPAIFNRISKTTTVSLIPDILKYLDCLIKFIPKKNNLRKQWLQQPQPPSTNYRSDAINSDTAPPPRIKEYSQ